MANVRSKNTRSVPSKRAGRHRPPELPQQPAKQPRRTTRMVVNAKGKKRMV